MVIPRAVQVELEALAGKRAGYVVVRRQLGEDPCQEALGAYRLSGPLQPVVCGVRLKNGYRLAFTMQLPLTPAEDARTRVVILYVGKREPGHRKVDVWDVLHDLFEVGNPPSGHAKLACCDDGQPEIDAVDLDRFLSALRRFQRGR